MRMVSPSSSHFPKLKLVMDCNRLPLFDLDRYKPVENGKYVEPGMKNIAAISLPPPLHLEFNIEIIIWMLFQA